MEYPERVVNAAESTILYGLNFEFRLSVVIWELLFGDWNFHDFVYKKIRVPQLGICVFDAALVAS